MAMAAAPVMAHADEHSNAANDVLSFITKISAHYQIVLLRTFVDLTYDNISVSPGGDEMVLNGVKLYPELEWDKEAKCEVAIDRMVTGSVYSFETLGSNIEANGVTVSPDCIMPDVAGMMSSFGYNGLTADAMSINISYNLPSSSATMNVLLSVQDAADISIDADFSYFWFRLPLEGGDDPIPVIQLAQAEVGIENRGLWERLEPMVAAQMGDVNAIPQMAQMMVGQAFSEGGQRQPTADEHAFVENLSAELARFLTEKNRLVVTAAPEGGVWLDETIFDSPQTMVAALKPQLSSTTSAVKAIIPPADMIAALASGANPDDATRLKIGKALLTGVGAPRATDKGVAMLMPLADAWNGDAAAMVAKASAANGADGPAYEMALRALASGASAAMGTADALESRMNLSDVLAAQQAVLDGWPGAADAEAAVKAAIEGGDVGAMRKMAYALSVGRGMPRSYKAGYAAATLAAAAGDRGAANLRDRMNARFGTDAAWLAAAAEAEEQALKAWVEDGFGAKLAGQ